LCNISRNHIRIAMMEFCISFLKESNPLETWIRRSSKNKFRRWSLNWEQIINDHIHRLKSFEKFKNINSPILKDMKHSWMDSIGKSFRIWFVFFGRFYLFSFNILIIWRDNAQSWDKPTITDFTLNNITWLKIFWEKWNLVSCILLFL